MALDDFITALDGTDEVELGTVGRVSGEETSRPVWFVHQGDILYLVPITGSDSQWYKNVRATPRIHLTAAGAEYRTQSETITDPDRVRSVLDEFSGKYGAGEVAKNYKKRDVAVAAHLD
jgi:hypothetical protein